MQDKWIPVFTTDQAYNAEYVKETLNNNGIEAVIMNQKDSSYHFGSISVMVNQENEEKAMEILKSANSGE